MAEWIRLAGEARLKPDTPTHHDPRARQVLTAKPVREATEAGVTLGKQPKGGGASRRVGGVSGFGDLGSRDVTPYPRKPGK